MDADMAADRVERMQQRQIRRANGLDDDEGASVRPG
jgi:hypothetical protein